MNKYAAILLLFFAMSITAFAQSSICAATESEAQILLEKARKSCEDFSFLGQSVGGSFSGNVAPQIYPPYEGQYCIVATCDICSSPYANLHMFDMAYYECCSLDTPLSPRQSFSVPYTCYIPSISVGVSYSQIRYNFTVSGFCTDQVGGICVGDFSSSSIKASSSSSEAESDSDGNSSSSNGGGGSSGSGGDGGDDLDDDDSELCFSNFMEAWAPNFMRRAECVASGGDDSGFEVVLNPQSGLWCLAGSCDVPSSSSGSDGGEVCSSVAGELTDAMAGLIVDCIVGKPENSHNYKIEYFRDNPPEKLFCITGMCNFSESSGSSSNSSDAVVCKEVPGRVNNGERGYLSCPGSKISKITFASYGVPVVNPGNCSYSIGGCHDPTSKSVVESFCLGRSSCSFTIAPGPIFGGDFGNDPCVGVVKFFVVSWECGDSAGSSSSYSSSSVSSSSSDISSSSFVSSSSSDEESSSSSKPEPSSSSSQQIAVACKHNERGSDAIYTAGDCFSGGLDSMEPGKCYSLNPDRGTQHGWINNNAQDDYWWVEKPCDGSEPIEVVTPGGCKNNKRGENAVYTSDDCFSGGLDNMEPGKCYSLNPERGTQHGWISNNAQDGYWWVETSCDDEVEFCPRGLLWADGNNNILYKKAAAEATESYYEFPWRTKNYLYDVLGKRTYDDHKTRRFLFSKGVPLDNSPKEPLVLLRAAPVKDSYGNECGVFGRDYGFVRDGYLHGGKTCHNVDAIVSEEAIVEEALGRCGKGKEKTRLHGTIPARLSLVTNKIYYVEEGDRISGLHGVLGMNVVDKATEIKMCRHEAGHQRDNARIVREETVYIPLDITACGCPESWKMTTDFLNAEREKIRRPYYGLIENAAAEYHRLHDNDGAPGDVECPN